jgi:uncharacterized protein YjbJ (UPF0337 family)
MDDQNKDLGTQGTEDTVSGKMKKAAGKVESKVGQVTGNEDMEARGKAKQVEGSVQSTVGKGERKVDSALDQASTPDEPTTTTP